ncbi:hypothetical protein BJX99DRAFT_252555 [Aspergillus californicus]
MRYHATNKLLPPSDSSEQIKQTWVFESHPLSELVDGNGNAREAKLLVKILIGKIVCGKERFRYCLERVDVLQDTPEFTCRTWVREVVARIAGEGLLSNSSIIDWEVIEKECRDYAGKKTDEGRFKQWTPTTPTYDLLVRKEIKP